MLTEKIIWTYWHQGFDDPPLVVQKCTRQMQKLHPDWKVRLLDQNSVYEFAEEVPVEQDKWNQLSLAAKSDMLRTQLLIKYGGVWMDPTVFCKKPLDEWLMEVMGEGVFLFHRPGKDRIISSWFIAAEKNHFLLENLYDALNAYWNNNEFRNLGRSSKSNIEYWIRRIINNRSLELSQVWLSPLFRNVLRFYPYFFFHFMFYRLLKRDKKAAETFQKMPKISADGPHRLQRLGLLNDLTTEAKQLIDKKESPVFKLKWNLGENEIPQSSILSYLFQH